MKMKRGFTLLEMLIVIVIIGILAGLAIPKYQKSLEYSKGTEAIANLNILRGAELRYWGEYGFETSNLNHLDVENPNLNATYFNYLTTAVDGDINGDFTFIAIREGGIYDGDNITIDQNGNYTGSWPFINP